MPPTSARASPTAARAGSSPRRTSAPRPSTPSWRPNDWRVGTRSTMINRMATLPRTEQAVARRLAGTADPRVALARALAEIGESQGWPFGAVWETSPDRVEALRCTEVWHDGGPGRAEFARA